MNAVFYLFIFFTYLCYYICVTICCFCWSFWHAKWTCAKTLSVNCCQFHLHLSNNWVNMQDFIRCSLDFFHAIISYISPLLFPICVTKEYSSYPYFHATYFFFVCCNLLWLLFFYCGFIWANFLHFGLLCSFLPTYTDLISPPHTDSQTCRPDVIVALGYLLARPPRQPGSKWIDATCTRSQHHCAHQSGVHKLYTVCLIYM